MNKQDKTAAQLKQAADLIEETIVQPKDIAKPNNKLNLTLDRLCVALHLLSSVTRTHEAAFAKLALGENYDHKLFKQAMQKLVEAGEVVVADETEQDCFYKLPRPAPAQDIAVLDKTKEIR